MKKLLLIACIIFADLLASSQISTFLEKGKSGIGLKGVYEKSNGSYGFGGKIGGSVSGKFDIEFTYQNRYWDQYKNNLLTDDATSAYYEGKLTWWLIRKEIIPSFEVNFGPFAGFDYGPYTNYKFIRATDGKAINYDQYTDAQFGLTASVNFRVAKSWFLQSSFIFIHEVGSQQETSQSVKRTYSDSGVTGKIGFTIMKRFNKGGAIYLTEEEVSNTFGSSPAYQISLGYVLPF
jgi:hypothetical protein